MRRFTAWSFFLLLALATPWPNVKAQTKPTLMVQTGHTEDVLSVAFSPDGKLLASGGRDGLVKLWDTSAGNELLNFALEGEVNHVEFSPDGQILAAGGETVGLTLWDMKTGRRLRRIGERAPAFAFSPNSKWIVVEDERLAIYDVGTVEKIRELEGVYVLHSISFSPDGRMIAAGGFDGDIHLWDAATGELLSDLRGHQKKIQSIAFSPSGKLLASGSDDRTVKFWNVSSGKELRSITTKLDAVFSVAFSPDGKMVASAGLAGPQQLWDATTGQLLNTLSGSFICFSIAFSPDGACLAIAGHTVITVQDARKEAKPLRLAGHVASNDTVAFDPQGRVLFAGRNLWDLGAGTLKRTYADKTFAGFSPDGSVFAMQDMRAIHLFDAETGEETQRLTGQFSGFDAVAFSSDGKTLFSRGDNMIHVWNTATGVENFSFPVGNSSAGAKGLLPENSNADLALSPDGKIIASYSKEGVVLWSSDKGQKLRVFSTNGQDSRSLAFSPDNKLLASVLMDANSELSLVLWDVASGRELRRLKESVKAGGEDTLAGALTRLRKGIMSIMPGTGKLVAFSPDGKILATVSGDQRQLVLWDVTTGARVRALAGHNGEIKSLAFSADGRMLASASDDGTTKLWDVATGQELVTLLSLVEDTGKESKGDDESLVVAPDGLFDGAPQAWGKILWRFSTAPQDYLPVEAYFNEFYAPGLLSDLMHGKRQQAKVKIAQLDRRPPKLSLTTSLSSGAAPTAAREVSIKLTITDAPAGARDVRLFRNGSLVKVWPGDVLKDRRTVTLETIIPIVTGENRLSAYAFNRDNIKSSDATLIVNGAESLKRVGTLYILAVGVNEYANKAFNLRYAVPDAEDFSTELKRQQDKLGAYDHTEIISLNNEQAKKRDILDALATLQKKALPEDAIVIYFAGHGTVGSCQINSPQTVNTKDRFYLVPYDLGYNGPIPDECNQRMLDTIKNSSISDEELESAFRDIDAGQILLIIDACNSGQALESEEKRRGPMNSRGLAQLAYEKGMYILTAAQSFQEAKADRKVAKGHGYLTYALVEEALKSVVADVNQDGQVDVREWVNYAVQRVPGMQQSEAQEKRQFVKRQGEKATEEDVQQPRVFYRREADSNPFIVAKVTAGD